MWYPTTMEDHLLWEHSKKHPGIYYLELAVRRLSGPGRERRIDAVFIRDECTRFLSPADYTSETARAALQDSNILVVEAKRALNRTVIGQVLVARRLMELIFQPLSQTMQVVCIHGNPDLEEYCRYADIEVCLYPDLAVGKSDDEGSAELSDVLSHAEPSIAPVGKLAEEALAEMPEVDPGNENSSAEMGRRDLRLSPDSARRRAFLAGWTAGANGTLYNSVHDRKTHANMGNLFGWIYGHQDDDFREDTWWRYVEYGFEGGQDEETDAGSG